MNQALVAYFSASGVTARVAKQLAEAIQGDLHEIIPSIPYTEADLDWQDEQSRSSIEMKDRTYRPTIANHVAHMETYDIILIGFPIWWYVAPTIIHTFLEQYDLKGKRIVPFATSGSSGMGNTKEDLIPSCPGALILEGKRFAASCTKEDIVKWVTSLPLSELRNSTQS